jgi:LmbE family N-acetylglucosaminyl deacetylase
MKYSIIASHPDDEFIGCHQFIKHNADKISNVIFFSNGEKSVNSFVGPEYAHRRRIEAASWWYKINPKTRVHFLNVPDGINDMEFVSGFGADVFKDNNGITRTTYILNQIKNIVLDDIVLTCEFEDHPTHALCYGIVENLKNPKVYYNVWSLWLYPLQGDLSFHPMMIVDLEGNRSIYYQFTKEEYIAKEAEFKKYYTSQHKDLLKSNLRVPNYELYYAPKGVKVFLCS